MTTPRATVREVNGELVLDDPDAMAVLQAFRREDCRATLRLDPARIAYFAGRVAARPEAPGHWVIVYLNADDPVGIALLDLVMPGHDWDAIRATGATPFGRGLVGRRDILDIVGSVDPVVAATMAPMTLPVLVADYGVLAAFEASEAAL